MDKKIGERIKVARKAAGMTQDDLARICGYKHKSSITKIEHGETDLPTEMINTISTVLGVSSVYLTTGMQPPEDVSPMRGWIDDLVVTAGQLTRARRMQLIEFAQFLSMLDKREEREAYISSGEILGEKFPLDPLPPLKNQPKPKG